MTTREEVKKIAMDVMSGKIKGDKDAALITINKIEWAKTRDAIMGTKISDVDLDVEISDAIRKSKRHFI